MPSKPLISYGSMLAQQVWITIIKKKLRNWLREVLIQAMPHVQKDSTQSAHSEEPDKSQRVWKAEIGVSRVGIDAASSGSP